MHDEPPVLPNDSADSTNPQVEEYKDEVVFLDEPAVVEEAVAVEATEEAADVTPFIAVKRNGVETDTVFPLSASNVIGRFDPAVGPIDVDLGSLPEGSYVSRKHAKITSEEGIWKLTDLGSSNGTFILRSDFERVEETELTDGDEFALGNARFVFHLG